MTDGLNRIVEAICRGVLGLLGMLAGYQFGVSYLKGMQSGSFFVDFIAVLLSVCVCGFVGVLLAPFFLRVLHAVSSFLAAQLKNTSGGELSSALAGLLVGLILANLLVLPFRNASFGPYLAVLLNVLIGFVMSWVFIERQKDIREAVASVKGKLTQRLRARSGHNASATSAARSDAVPHKVLDTSVIIDGRILDIAKTGFLQGTLILPSFVLLELQTVADSKDQTKRTRGRLGLDVVRDLQKLPDVKIRIEEATLKDFDTEYVDSAVVSMAKKYGCEVLTTDYNLNKVAQIQNVRVLNVNDLANAMKPVVLPGDEAVVDVIKRGKDARQGIGYLDDGTMLVVENGGPYIGKRVAVTLSSMLQTSAGRMVFGRVKEESKN
ncbi:MAG: PIN/TRAM domain-containing protein [Pyramidobacter sp.]|jgi:uncharacterized protein YacL